MWLPSRSETIIKGIKICFRILTKGGDRVNSIFWPMWRDFKEIEDLESQSWCPSLYFSSILPSLDIFNLGSHAASSSGCPFHLIRY